MIVLQVNDLYKSFGGNEILKNIKLEIKEKDRIAIVGRNGCGKSTLLKILAGELSYDYGEIIKPKDITIGYLSQHTDLQSTQTIWQEMESVFSELINMQHALQKLEEKMAHSEYINEELLEQYDQLLQKFQNSGGYEYEAKIRNILSGLDFPEKDYHKKIQALSGGQKTRLALGKLLLESPDLLILDEPTNHLDIETLSWLETYLKNYPGALLIVSHDRYFLEQTVSIIYEIAHKHMKRYIGGYEKFLEQTKSDYEIQLKRYEQQQEEIKRAEEFIERNIARASTSRRAQSRRKQLERLERIEKPLGDEASAKFTFQINRRSGNDVLHIKDIAFSYDKKNPLFSQVKFNVHRGERIALIGPNGIGKTTLLKVISKQIDPTYGTVEHGTNVEVGYYDQEQQLLTPTKTVLSELWYEYPHVNERDIRTVLGNFLFSGEDVLKQVSSLSGGEKARLSLAKLMMKQANLLILDEPTNHLDIDSQEILESALKDYPGTIVFVSHDRYFINKIADRIVELSNKGATVYLGNYDYFLQKKEEEKERARLEEKSTHFEDKPKSSRKQSLEKRRKKQREERRRKRKIQELEQRIEKLEKKLNNVEAEMTKPDVYQDYEKSLELSKKADKLKQDIFRYMEKWEQLHE